MVFHTADWIHKGLLEAAVRLEFNKSLQSETKFGTAVAIRLMETRAATARKHPSAMEEFNGCRPLDRDTGKFLKDKKK